MPYFKVVSRGLIKMFLQWIPLLLLVPACTSVHQGAANSGSQGALKVEGSAFRTEKLSEAYYDSLALCQTTEDAVLNFELPEPENLWNKIRLGYALEPVSDKRVQQQLNWYVNHPSYMSRVTRRGRRYMHYIVERLDERGMPMELALLPIVESAFDPFAYSHGRASGMWQIIPGTGEMLGLKQNWWYDGRRDVIASTDAALNYLEKLHKQMDGDWELAIAAYNSGAGNVNKAIRKNKKRGKPTNFWSLDLPKETESYVPKLLALREIVLNPDKYEMELYPIANEPSFEQVDIGSQIDLAQAASMAEIEMDELYVLNPAFNRWATDPDGPHYLLMPIENADIFKQALSEIPEDQRVTWERYTIRSGDSLSTIATQYNTTTSALQSINGIRGTDIRAGKTLLVPIATASAKHYAYSLPQRIKRTQSRGKGHKVQYTVQTGDSLWSIGKQYKASSKKIAKWNGMAPNDPIRPGQQLVIWTEMPSSDADAVVRKIGYKVRTGDSLARIAGKFNVNVADIQRWNQVNPKKYLQPGDHLTLFVDVRSSSIRD